ncbi:MAG: NAD(P)/FAD-dependent oxidoreductase [Pseudomonadota bacterium]
MDNFPAVVIGAGPAGLTTAFELSKHGVRAVTFEQAATVGGIARTEAYKGYRFDIGGHRFFTKVKEVEQLWHEVLADDLIKVPRLSRIYYRGKFFQYPLEPLNALQGLGLANSVMIGLSYLKAKLRPTPVEDNFEEWVINRFGERLYRTFFKAYTEKVWGIPCTQIQAEWAAQRIQGLSLRKAATNALFGTNDTKTLIGEFDYPRLGPGMMWERFSELLNERDSPVELETEVAAIEHIDNRITCINVLQAGHRRSVTAEHFVSSMPISKLVQLLEPAAPESVVNAARSLRYRDFLIVSLIVDQDNLFPDNWIYIHSPEFKVGRIQNFKNWSREMVPEDGRTCLGMEYFCSRGDDVWSSDDEALIELAGKEAVNLGLVESVDLVKDGTVIRQPRAYPVYDENYRGHLETIQNYLKSFKNLHTVGRNGMHRYNNQDHSMMTGILAARNILGADHDLWEVNTDDAYHEEIT